MTTIYKTVHVEIIIIDSLLYKTYAICPILFVSRVFSFCVTVFDGFRRDGVLALFYLLLFDETQQLFFSFITFNVLCNIRSWLILTKTLRFRHLLFPMIHVVFGIQQAIRGDRLTCFSVLSLWTAKLRVKNRKIIEARYTSYRKRTAELRFM